MMQKTILAIGALLLGLACWWCFFAEGTSGTTERADAPTLSAEPNTPLSAKLPDPSHQIVRNAEDEPAATTVDPGLRVLVLGPDGLPRADMEVGIVNHQERYAQSIQTVWSAMTNAEGRAQCPQVAELVAATRAGQRRAVMVLGVLPEVERVYLTRPEVWSEEIVLRTVEYGEVHIRATDPAGRPVREGRALLVMPGEDYDQQYVWNREGAPSLVLPIEDGVAKFRHVALHQKLLAAAELSIPSSIEALSRTDALTHPGQVLELDLTLGTDVRLLQMRIVDQNQAPVQRTFITTNQFCKEDWRGNQGGNSMDDGLIWFKVLCDPREPAEGRIELALMDGRSASASYSLPAGLGVKDLGDIVVKLPSAVLAGMVELPDGTRARHARLSIAVQRPAGAADLALKPAQISSDAEGIFSFHPTNGAELNVEDRFVVFASTDEFVSAIEVLLVGTSTAHIRLNAPGRIDARLEGPSWLLSGRPSFHLRPVQGRSWPYIGGLSATATDGRLQFHSIPPGHYRLYGPESKLLLQDLKIESGATCSDPRLDPLVLKDDRVQLEFEVQPFAGLQLMRGEIFVRSVDREPTVRESAQISGEVTRIAVPAGTYQGWIRVEGARFERFTGVTAKHKIALRPGYEIELRLPPSTPIPELPEGLRARLELQGSIQDPYVDLTSVYFDRAGRTRLSMPYSGTWKLTWKRGKLEGAEVRERTIEEPTPQHITVLDQAELQVFELQPPPI